jgi:hypothetical protein
MKAFGLTFDNYFGLDRVRDVTGGVRLVMKRVDVSCSQPLLAGECDTRPQRDFRHPLARIGPLAQDAEVLCRGRGSHVLWTRSRGGPSLLRQVD